MLELPAVFSTIDHGTLSDGSLRYCLTLIPVLPGWSKSEGSVGGILSDTLAIGLWGPPM